MNCLELEITENRLTQGDVITFIDSENYMEKSAIIVTADCDLSKKKHWGRVTVIPLIPAKDYFEEIFLPKEIEKLEKELTIIFGKIIGKILNGNESEVPTQDALDSLISLETLPKSLSNSKDAVKIHSLIRKARGYTIEGNCADMLDQALLLRNPKTKTLSQEKIKNFLDNPPGDCMILPEMAGLPSTIHIAFLRVIRELRDEDIALKTSQQESKKAQRVGRLIPVVRYRLTQMLAQVFSDIGLPAIYEHDVTAGNENFLNSLRSSQREFV